MTGIHPAARRFTLVLMVLCSVFLGTNSLIALREATVRGGNHARTALRAVHREGAKYEVAVVGSSHVFAGVDPQGLSVPGINLSGPAFDLRVCEALLRENLQRLPSVRLVIVELSPTVLFFDTVRFREGDFRDLRDWDLPGAALPMTNIESLKYDTSRWFPCTDGRGLADFWLATQRDAREPGYSPLAEVLPGRKDAAADACHHDRLGTADPRDNLESLRKIRSLLTERGIRMVVWLPPHHPAYWEAFPETRSAQLQQALETVEREIVSCSDDIWDLRIMAPLTDQDFADGHHVNVRGTAILTAELDRRLASCSGIIERKN